jgi:hypothetical protein
MAEVRVSATDLRVHLKDLANQVAERGDVIVMERHGFAMGVLVNMEEYEEFKRFREKQGKAAPAPARPVEIPRAFPESMELDEVERIYKATGDRTDDHALWWRYHARHELRAAGRLEAKAPS